MPAVAEGGRRRWWRALVVLVLVVVVLLVAVDRIGLAVAERKVADKVQTTQHLESRPAVTIEGFPFLTQVVANRYRVVRLNAKALTVGTGGDRLQISTLTARLTGVRATGNYSGVTAQTVTGTATVGYSELSRVLGVALAYGGAGRVQVSQRVSLLGRTITATASASVGVDDSTRLTFTAVKVSVADAGVTLPQSVTDQFASIFSKQLSLSGLPFSLRVRSLVATQAGVAITAGAQDVNLG